MVELVDEPGLRGCTKSAKLRRSKVGYGSSSPTWQPNITQGDPTTRPSYPSDLTHEEWLLLEPEMPALKTGGRPRSVPWREIVNGILYVLRTGCAWRSLPHDQPSWSTVYHYFRL